MNINFNLSNEEVVERLKAVSTLDPNTQSVDYHGRVYNLNKPPENYTYCLPGCGAVKTYVKKISTNLYNFARSFFTSKAPAENTLKISSEDQKTCIRHAYFVIDAQLDRITKTVKNCELIEQVVKSFNELVKTNLGKEDHLVYLLDSRVFSTTLNYSDLIETINNVSQESLRIEDEQESQPTQDSNNIQSSNNQIIEERLSSDEQQNDSSDPEIKEHEESVEEPSLQQTTSTLQLVVPESSPQSIELMPEEAAENQIEDDQQDYFFDIGVGDEQDEDQSNQIVVESNSVQPTELVHILSNNLVVDETQTQDEPVKVTARKPRPPLTTRRVTRPKVNINYNIQKLSKNICNRVNCIVCQYHR